MLDAAQGLVRAERVAAALLEVSERLSTLTDPDEVPRTLVAAIRSATGASLAGVARWSTANERVEFAAFEGLTPEEQAALEAQALAAGQAPTPFTSPLVSEPDQVGGMPLYFLNQTTPPLGNTGFSGSAAAVRRGAAEGQFVEPPTRDQ